MSVEKEMTPPPVPLTAKQIEEHQIGINPFADHEHVVGVTAAEFRAILYTIDHERRRADREKGFRDLADIFKQNALDRADIAESALSTTTAECARLREALTKCQVKFLEYEAMHLAKNTADGKEKADRNYAMAQICAEALSTLSASATAEQDMRDEADRQRPEIREMIHRDLATPAPKRSDRPHINTDGQFQSDKYPTCPPGKVPLSVKDATAQDLLWEYAQRRRSVDAEFADDLETCLKAASYAPAPKRDTQRTPGTIEVCSRCHVERSGSINMNGTRNPIYAWKNCIHDADECPVSAITRATPAEGTQ